ncbi:Galactose/lactose metabolism regulatory protein GAL80 [Lachnellula suecica]|uniref:Galactose/lactose metabolism regulatory protein GAL80 n=1 Tax=Lachnellula suecica TaxID=602035 RepID=A0A8T9CCL2_9HELO|nr:Galactose/lactose metabolism regulatory protein GAL80 [Lachnellula suecica]
MASTKAPTRVGIIGLGFSDSTFGPGLWAGSAHVPYLLASPDYTITAICNSTTASAQASIDHYKLDPTIKAYGSPSDLAADPNVDLILVSVRVAAHYALTKPALLAGKEVFVEWPLAATLAQSEELTALAKEKGVRNIVGVQARASPLITKLRSLLTANSIGSILSTTVVGTFSGLPHDVFPVGAEYYMDINSGGNPFYIFFGHFLDSFLHVLGPWSEDPHYLSAVLDTKYTTTKLVDFATGEVKGEIPRTAPDHVLVQGKLASDALASISYRTVPTAQVQEPGIIWTITGTEGEIVVEARQGQWQMLGAQALVVKMRQGKGEVETIELSEELEGNKAVEAMGGVYQAIDVGDGGYSGRNVARVYEALVKGDKAKFATFEQALESQRLLERIRKVAGK